jgi:hypothetical protein
MARRWHQLPCLCLGLFEKNRMLEYATTRLPLLRHFEDHEGRVKRGFGSPRGRIIWVL